MLSYCGAMCYFWAMKPHKLTHTSHHIVVIETATAALVIGWLDKTLCLKEEATYNMPLNMPQKLYI